MNFGRDKQAHALSRLLLERGLIRLDRLLLAWARMGSSNDFDLVEALQGREGLDKGALLSLATEAEADLDPANRDGQTLFISMGNEDPGATKSAVAVEPSTRGSGENPDPMLPSESGERYRIESEIGAGGAGRVLCAVDRLFGRKVALKVLREGAAAGESAEIRFGSEARAAAKLEHPNIVPVYDAGRLSSGEAFLAMRLVQGATLKEVLLALSQNDENALARFGFVRLLTMFGQVCLAIDYAHTLGLAHRDLKPDNVLVGEYGETLVTDWGLARKLRSAKTCDGAEGISGTPAYMSPEQATGQGDVSGRLSDVYGLGAILYEILTLTPPFHGESPDEIMKSVISDKIETPSRRAPSRRIPDALETACMRALSKKPDERQQSAREIHDEVEAYLEGTREKRLMRRRAKSIAFEASGEADGYFEAKKRLDDMHEKLDLELGAKNTELWTLEESVQDAQIRCDRRFTAAVSGLGQALSLHPDLGEARRNLARLHHSRYLDAAKAQNKKEMIYNRRLVEHNDPVSYRDELYGSARLDIESLPEGAEVLAAPVEDRDGLLIAGHAEILGETPLYGVQLKRGHWLISLHLDGCIDAQYPLLLEAGEQLRLSMPMPSLSEADSRFAYIPPGPFIKGGDELATGNEKSRTPRLDGFFIARQPVSLGEYLSFIEEAGESGFKSGNVPAKAPRIRPDRGYYFGERGEARSIDSNVPVVGISWEDASAYAAWLSQREGYRYALPNDEQWEKAARGADGRIYPWGNVFHAEFCMMRDGPRHASLQPLSRFPRDRSPFGVFGMAGGVREWCDDWFNPQAGERLTKGGSWLDPEPLCRLASRIGMKARRVKPNIGFRLVRLLSPELRRM